MLVLVLGLFAGKEQSGPLAGLSVVGLAGIAVLTALSWGESRTAFGRMMVIDNFYVFFAVLSLASTAVAVLLSTSYVSRMELAYPEFFGLLIFGASGMLVMASATNLIVLLIGIELLSLS